jgi:hypothetical protein
MESGASRELVVPGLVPGIHVLVARKTWMAGTSPAMTNREGDFQETLN